MPTPPELAPESRRAGLERSLELRRERARIKALISQSSRGLALSLLGSAFDPVNVNHPAQGMKVRDLLTALPRIGTARANALLEAAGIPERATVRSCGPRQRERLFALLAK